MMGLSAPVHKQIDLQAGHYITLATMPNMFNNHCPALLLLSSNRNLLFEFAQEAPSKEC